MPYADKAKQIDYQRRWIQKRRADYFKGKACASCGCSDINMQLDHIDPDTKASHKIWSWSQARREEELKKCQILCVDCHKKKTVKDIQDWHKKKRHNDSLISDSPDDSDITDFSEPETDIPF